MAEPAYLTADEAAAYLGVSRQTIYAYVSRGLVVSEPGPAGSGRARRYSRAALDDLKARREREEPREEGPLRWGGPLLDSALTLISDGRLYYRGHDARDLSRTATLEEVASLLWTGDRAAASTLFAVPPSRRRKAAGGSFADRLAASLVAQRREAAVTLTAPTDAALRAAARAVLQLFEAAGAHGPGTLAERLARGWRAPGAALNATLVLCADHELNTSSFTARCVASTDAPINNVLLAALCALEGRRHGGAAGEEVDALLDDAERDGARRACREAVARHGWLPSFARPAHRLYPAGDPRADEILTRLGLRKRDPIAQVLAFASGELGAQPSLEFALVSLARRAGLPRGAAFTLFALGRSVGWVAHALETAADGKLIRPRARYTGPTPAP